MINNLRSLIRKYYWIGILIFPLVILLPGMMGFPYPPSQGSYSDIAISHYPDAIFLRNTIMQEHNLPLWSPTILSGYPFFANPLSGLYYPPGWLALLLPLPLGFNLLIFLHLLWGGLGMMLLLRDEGLPQFPAVFGAVAFIAMPKLFAHYGAGHLTLLYAVTWTPWLFLASRKRYFRNHLLVVPAWRRVLYQPGLVWALILLADVRWAAFSGLLWWYYLFFYKIRQSWKDAPARFIVSLFAQTIMGLLIAAPLLLPLYEYVGLSTRAGMGVQDMFTFSFPPIKILGLLFPDIGGFHEWVIYCGALVLLLSLTILARARQTAATLCWIGAVLLSIFFALGSSIPAFDLIAGIPGLNLLRVPSRMIFITGLSLAALAAHQLQWLISGLNTLEIRRLRLSFAGLVAFILFLTAAVWLTSGKLSPPFIWGSIFILAGIAWMALLEKRQVDIRIWQLGLLVICLIDLIGVDLSLFTMRSAKSVLAEGEPVARYLSKQPGDFRIYSPTYSLPQQTSALNQLEMASGVDPLQLKSYVEFMEAASGVPHRGYSVVLPPMVAEGQFPDKNYIPDASLLGMLNIGYVLADYPIQSDGLDEEAKFGDSVLYKNRYTLPRAWVESGVEHLPAQVVKKSPNWLMLKASGPGLLVLAEVDYPGWRAWVDGEPEPVLAEGGLLRSVSLDPGAHEVLFRFVPVTLYVGLALMVVGILLAILVGRGWS